MSESSFKKQTKEFRSEMQEVISSLPPWFIRWGMTIIFILVVIGIGMSAWVKYPDVIRLPLRISSFDSNASIADTTKKEFFGEMSVPEELVGKIKKGQDVLVKLKSFPFQQFGVIKGKISNVQGKEPKGVGYTAIVSLNVESSGFSKEVHLRDGLAADVEVIAQNNTLLSKIVKGLTKNAN